MAHKAQYLEGKLKMPKKDVTSLWFWLFLDAWTRMKGDVRGAL